MEREILGGGVGETETEELGVKDFDAELVAEKVALAEVVGVSEGVGVLLGV